MVIIKQETTYMAENTIPILATSGDSSGRRVFVCED